MTTTRKEKTAFFQQLPKLINSIGILAALALVIHPTPFEEYMVPATLLIPILALLLTRLFPNISVYRKQGSQHQSPIIYVVLISGVMLAVRGFFDYQILEYNATIFPTLLLFIGLLSLVIIRSKEFSFQKVFDYFRIAGLAILLLLYSFGTIMIVNCRYDRSQVERYATKILKKERKDIDHVISYHLTLAPWEKQQKINELKVDKAKFIELTHRDTIQLYVKKGLFGAEWFEVE